MVISLVRGMVRFTGQGFPGGEKMRAATARFFRSSADLVSAPRRKHAAVAAMRNAAGVCAECGVLPMDRDGTCDECWVEQHAGP